MININHIIPNFLSYIIFLTIHFSYYSKFQIYLPPLHFHFNLYFTFVGTALCCAVLWVVTHILCVSDRERQRERVFGEETTSTSSSFISVRLREERTGKGETEMEKALTKVGSFWISKKAKAEISNITEDLSVCFTWILHIFFGSIF